MHGKGFQDRQESKNGERDQNPFMQRAKIQTGQQTQGGVEIEVSRRKEPFPVAFLIILMAALIWPHSAQGADRKAKRQAAKPVVSAPDTIGVNDLNLQDYVKAGEDQLKKGKTDEALSSFHAVYRYTDDNLKFMACVREAYEKAQNDPNLAQNQKETLYLKLQRLAGLTTRYTKVKREAAYNLGLVYSKKGDAAQARGYLLDACRTAPFSLDAGSLWMKSKDLFLSISNLDGEF
jgi:tetratricopeptide (TPR) repeat protein